MNNPFDLYSNSQPPYFQCIEDIKRYGTIISIEPYTAFGCNTSFVDEVFTNVNPNVFFINSGSNGFNNEVATRTAYFYRIEGGVTYITYGYILGSGSVSHNSSLVVFHSLAYNIAPIVVSTTLYFRGFRVRII